MKYWEIKMKAEKVGELLLYGEISNFDFWGDEVTPKQIDAELKALGPMDTLNVRINSGGGSVFAGQAIYSILKRCDAKEKVAYIDGLAASIASIIPMACDKVIMPGNAMMMIHRPWAGATGDAEDLRQMAEVLDKVEGTMVDIYEAKTQLDRQEIADMLAAETWMTAQEAKDKGFIDEIEQDMKVAASIKDGTITIGEVTADLSRYKNIPEMYRAEIDPPEPVANKNPVDHVPEPPAPEPDPPVNLAEQTADFMRLRKKLLGGE